MEKFISIANGGSFALDELPVLPENDFRECVIGLLSSGKCRLSGLFIQELPDQKVLTAILAAPSCARLHCTATAITGSTFKSLTPEIPAAEHFEREILETYAIMPEGHPCPKPIRSADTEYYTVSGDAVHEVAVGPIHAGVIEPGHFRFQCMGEKVYSLEIFLGYQSRGVEKLLAAPWSARTMPLIETTAGDTSAAAAENFCRCMESLAGIDLPPRAAALRVLAIELERIANHVGDLGALAGDVAFLPTASFCGRIRGDYLNCTAMLCGNRFGRNFILPGGVRYDLSAEQLEALKNKLAVINKELKQALDLLFSTPSCVDRFENTGRVPASVAAEIGLVGPAGRASGADIDIRREFPYGYYRQLQPAPVKPGSGDVLSRALVRYEEIFASLSLIDKLLAALPAGNAVAERGTLKLAPGRCAVALGEAWRGEVMHFVRTGSDGSIAQCKIVDPSFHNWFGLALALRGEDISNFPICNKSFNLSYCGHDL